MINRITFSYNWNQKLNCDYFTTLRLHNPKKYKVGDIKEVWIKYMSTWRQLENIEIVAVTTLPLERITEYMAYLDTGYNRSKAMQIIRRMYKQENPEMDFILCKKIKTNAKKREPLS